MKSHNSAIRPGADSLFGYNGVRVVYLCLRHRTQRPHSIMSTVLVVEDETNIRKFVTANLKARGYNVIEAPDAEQGLQQLKDTRPTVMLLDIMLPGMDGWSLLSLIRDDPYLLTVPVSVMTALRGERLLIQDCVCGLAVDNSALAICHPCTGG